MRKKIISLVAMIAFGIFLVPHLAEAFFWRNAGEGSAAQTSPSTPTTFTYGYGFGSAGFGWGYGYGYSTYLSNTGTGYYGQAQQLTSATISSNISTGALDLSQLVSSNAVQLAGSGTVTLTSATNSDVTMLIPAAVLITGGAGWDGIIQGPTIIDSSDTSDAIPNYVSGLATDSAILLAGSTSVSLSFSSAVTIRIPLTNYDSSKLPYSIYRIAAGGSNTSGTALTTCTTANIFSGTTAGSFLCEFTTTSLSRFYATAGSSTAAATATTGGGGGGGAPSCPKTKKGCPGYVAPTTPIKKPSPTSTDTYKPGEVATPFTDTGSHWANSYIETLRKAGIVHGKRKGIFEPNAQLTRAELTKIALNAFEIPVNGAPSKTPFKDVLTDAWYAPYIAKAKELNIVQGYSDGNFKPNASINRAEALKILLMAAGVEIDMANLDDLVKKGWAYIHFVDVPIRAWYAGYVDFAKTNGIVSGYGDGTFGPGNPVLRGEMAKIAVKTMEISE